MSQDQESVCFTCGLPFGGILRLNCLPGGQACPACRDRLLEELPPLLPSEVSTEAEQGLTGSEPANFEQIEGEEPATGPRLLTSKGPGKLLLGDGPNEPA